MPHIIVKCLSGKTEELKKKLAEELTKTAMSIVGLEEDAFSVSIEEIEPQNWKESVYIPFIIEQKDKLYKAPGYKIE